MIIASFFDLVCGDDHPCIWPWVTRGLSADMQTWLRWGEKTELRASDISETSVLVSRTVQELHFPCLHFEVKAAAKNGKARWV